VIIFYFVISDSNLMGKEHGTKVFDGYSTLYYMCNG